MSADLTDLADGQWFIAQHLIPAAQPGGRPRSLDMRLVANAIHFGRHKHPTAGSVGVRESRPAIHRQVCEATVWQPHHRTKTASSSIRWDSYRLSWSPLLTCLTAILPTKF